MKIRVSLVVCHGDFDEINKKAKMASFTSLSANAKSNMFFCEHEIVGTQAMCCNWNTVDGHHSNHYRLRSGVCKTEDH